MNTIDEYLELQSKENRAALEKLRKTIHSIVPNAEECISYGIPGFRLDGKVFLHIGAAANHCALYGMPEKDFADELADYETSGKGTIRFPPDRPLPAALLRKLVKARIARNAAKRGKLSSKLSSRA
jgi:uncharacterized protein YdhG (YjbR/CyaY superfamily)